MYVLRISGIFMQDAAIRVTGTISPGGCPDTELHVEITPLDPSVPGAPAPLIGIGYINDTSWEALLALRSQDSPPFPCREKFYVRVSCPTDRQCQQDEKYKKPFHPLNCCPSIHNAEAVKIGCDDPTGTGVLWKEIHFMWGIKRNDSDLPIKTCVEILDPNNPSAIYRRGLEIPYVNDDRHYSDTLWVQPGQTYPWRIAFITPTRCRNSDEDALPLPHCICPNIGELMVQDLNGNDLTASVQHGDCLSVDTVRVIAPATSQSPIITWSPNLVPEDSTNPNPDVVLAAVGSADSPNVVKAWIGSDPCKEERKVELKRCSEQPCECKTLMPDCKAGENWWTIAMAVSLSCFFAGIALLGKPQVFGILSGLIAIVSNIISGICAYLPDPIATKVLAVLSQVVSVVNDFLAFCAALCVILAVIAFIIAVVAFLIFLYNFILWLRCCHPKPCQILSDTYWAMLWAIFMESCISFVLCPTQEAAVYFFAAVGIFASLVGIAIGLFRCSMLWMTQLPSQR